MNKNITVMTVFAALFIFSFNHTLRLSLLFLNKKFSISNLI